MITIRGQGLQNLADHAYDYTGDIDALTALAKLHSYEVIDGESITALDMDDLKELVTLAKKGDPEGGVQWCDWCGFYKPYDEVWHLDCTGANFNREHICLECANETTAAELLNDIRW